MDLLKSGVSVRPYVRPSVSDVDIISCVGRSRPVMRTSVTWIRSKVKVKAKVKVTDRLKFRKLHFYRSISSAIFAWSSKLMVATIIWDVVYSLSELDFRISF